MDITKMGKIFMLCIVGGLLIVMGYFAAMLLPQRPAIALTLNLLGVIASLVYVTLYARLLWNLAQERRSKRNRVGP